MRKSTACAEMAASRDASDRALRAWSVAIVLKNKAESNAVSTTTPAATESRFRRMNLVVRYRKLGERALTGW